MRYWLLISTLLFGLTSKAPGQEWAKKMFDKTTHDFGVVARGADVKYTFTIKNIYQEDAHISSVRTSCRCTTPKPTKNFLKSWETADLEVEINTRTDPGRKDATITVVIDFPSRPDVAPAEVQLHTHTYIRSDVVVQPGVVQFGSVDAGIGWQQQASLIYAGRNDWQILRVESINPHIQGQVVEKQRGNGRVGYDLFVVLDSTTPPGYIREDIYLITNDMNPKAARFPVAVEGLITSPMKVSPNPLSFGAIQAGQSAAKNIIIQSKKPFRIVSVQSTDNRRLQYKISQDVKSIQLLPVTFTAPSEEGKFQGTIRIQTDQERVGPLDVSVDAQVLPETKP
jgi:hypothetical protein